MPKRTSSQRIGDVGENMVRELVDSHASWMCRAQDRDFGVDLEAELAPSEGEDQLPSGKLIKLQVKSSQVVDRSGSRVAISLDQGFLQYSNQFRVPVLLIAVELSTRRAWWIWLQAWWLENELRLASAAPTASRTVHIPEGQTLEAGSMGRGAPLPWGRHRRLS